LKYVYVFAGKYPHSEWDRYTGDEYWTEFCQFRFITECNSVLDGVDEP
jgi:hypothetical protein